MATICPSGRPWCSKNTNKKTYFEILWGGPHGANHNKHWKKPKNKNNKKNIWRLFGEGPRRKVKTHGKNKHWKNQSKNVFWGSWLTSPIPKTSGVFFPMFFVFSDDFLFFQCFSCFLYGALPEESANIVVFCVIGIFVFPSFFNFSPEAFRWWYVQPMWRGSN